MRKLRDNATTLTGLLSTTQLRRWLLVVPRWVNKDLHAHAEIIAAEIRACGLPYIAADFAPAIVTAEDFAVERQKLVVAGVQSLRIIISEVDPGECRDWVDGHDELVENLDRKALAVCRGRPAEARKLRDRFIKHYLEGRNALEKLRSYPDLYEAAFRVKQDREHFLNTESLIPDSLPPQKLKETIELFQTELTRVLPGMASFTIAQLVHEALADWLLRCPLDFPNSFTE